MAGEKTIIFSEKTYVVCMMTAKCTFGNMEHPLNVREVEGGHGVLYGASQEPVLNANDFIVNENIFHFGDCSSHTPYAEANKENAANKNFLEKAADFIVDGFFALIAPKCKPATENVWIEIDDKHILDGAPVVLVKSKLCCRRGGIIEIVAEIAVPEDEGGNETSNPAVEETMKEIEAEIDAAIAAGAISAETGAFMKESYAAALTYADGDIEVANKLFGDIARYGNYPAFGENESNYNVDPINRDFILYVKHNNPGLLMACTDPMVLGGASGDLSLREIMSVVAVNNNRVATAASEDSSFCLLDAVEMALLGPIGTRVKDEWEQYQDDSLLGELTGHKYFPPYTVDERGWPVKNEGTGLTYDSKNPDLPSQLTFSAMQSRSSGRSDGTQQELNLETGQISLTSVVIADTTARDPSAPIISSILKNL